MDPIKSNHFWNQSLPSDHAKIKSQPFKLSILTAISAVFSSFVKWEFPSTFFYP
ncbi:hypothetical protein Hanom_Chr14g01336761 [Helianthus anomalus]